MTDKTPLEVCAPVPTVRPYPVNPDDQKAPETISIRVVNPVPTTPKYVYIRTTTVSRPAPPKVVFVTTHSIPNVTYKKVEQVEACRAEPVPTTPSFSEIARVLKAAHLASMRSPADEPCEERGNAYGPASWHEGVALWTVVLEMVDTPSEATWQRLVEQATTVATDKGGGR